LKWFKHDANAMIDSKLKRLRLKYGMEGYGLYWYCLECIAKNVEAHNLTFELEEDAELIAADTGIHYERVEEMMRYMIDLRLFEVSDGIVTCLKMASRTDDYTSQILRKNDALLPGSQKTSEKLRRNFEETSESVETNFELLEEKRIEENRRDERDKKESHGEFENVRMTPEEKAKLSERFGEQNAQDLIERLSGYKKAKGKSYRSDYAALLNWGRKDGLKPPSPPTPPKSNLPDWIEEALKNGTTD